MSAGTVLAVAVTLAAGSAGADDKARPRDGGGSAGSSRSAGASRHSGNDRGSSSSDHGTSSWSKPGNDSSGAPVAFSESADRGRSRPPQTDAQRRHPRPGTGTGRFDNGGHRGNDYRSTWGSPYYGSGGYGYGYYNPYDSWYSPYYYSGYYGYSPSFYGRSRGGYPRGYGSYRDSGSLRIIVEPEKTRVYVDGYYAGIVDDFDGILQRLNVPPGRHDITLKLEGYRTQHFKVYVPVDDTIKIHYDMVRGAGEATSEQFAGVPADYARVEDLDDEDGRRGDEDRYDRRDDGRYEGRDSGRDQGDTGSVRLQVTPQDASVYVDGEFRGSGRQSANLRLRPGRHRIEVVRPGFRTVEREVEVERGRSTDLQFDLEKL